MDGQLHSATLPAINAVVAIEGSSAPVAGWRQRASWRANAIRKSLASASCGSRCLAEPAASAAVAGYCEAQTGKAVRIAATHQTSGISRAPMQPVESRRACRAAGGARYLLSRLADDLTRDWGWLFAVHGPFDAESIDDGAEACGPERLLEQRLDRPAFRESFERAFRGDEVVHLQGH